MKAKKKAATKKVAAKKKVTKRVTKAKKVATKKVTKKAKEAIDLVFPKHPPKTDVKAARRSKSAKDRKRIQMKKGFDIYCALIIMGKILNYKKGELERTYKGEAWDHFYEMLKRGAHPDSFEGFFQKNDTYAEATALFTLKTKQGELSQELADLFTRNGIPFENTVIVPQDGYNINPEIFELDQTQLGELAKAVQAAKLDPAKIFLPADPVSSSFMSDATLPAIMALNNEKLRVQLLAKITSRQCSDAKLDGETWNSDRAKTAAETILKDAGILP
jgi:hypothetical protein